MLCAFPCGRLREALFLLTSLHPFHCFTQASFTVHVLFIFLTNIDDQKYFTVPTVSFSRSLISVSCTLNFWLFVCYLIGAVVYTL